MRADVRLSRFIDMEKSGRAERWQYDPRPDIELLLDAYKAALDALEELGNSALLVQGGCDTAHLDRALDVADDVLVAAERWLPR